MPFPLTGFESSLGAVSNGTTCNSSACVGFDSAVTWCPALAAAAAANVPIPRAGLLAACAVLGIWTFCKSSCLWGSCNAGNAERVRVSLASTVVFKTAMSPTSRGGTVAIDAMASVISGDGACVSFRGQGVATATCEAESQGPILSVSSLEVRSDGSFPEKGSKSSTLGGIAVDVFKAPLTDIPPLRKSAIVSSTQLVANEASSVAWRVVASTPFSIATAKAEPLPTGGAVVEESVASTSLPEKQFDAASEPCVSSCALASDLLAADASSSFSNPACIDAVLLRGSRGGVSLEFLLG
mmetsp:Transcript_32981/g.52587  ORF Transcript_32981/g.52587 Transcript_32981/m.52587 type:complete len:297 (+) Transcript_32981:581-1471(+)